MLDDKSKDLEFTLYQVIKYVNVCVDEIDHFKEIIQKLNQKFDGIEFLRIDTRFNKKLTWTFKDDQVKHATDGREVRDINFYF